jgi:hypothetical protein
MLPETVLDEGEREVFERLRTAREDSLAELQLSEAYYLGEYVVRNLRISIPEELEFIRTVLGWGGLAVDPRVERMRFESFRFAGQTEADETLAAIMDGNGFEAELAMALTDAYSLGRGYITVGPGEAPGDMPLITADSPMNTAVEWDVRTRSPRHVLSVYAEGKSTKAVLQMPRKTLHLSHDGQDGSKWELDRRVVHDLPLVPVVRVAHAPLSGARQGRSAITPALRAIIQGASRTLLGLEVAREFYSVPQKAILGAAESDFINPDGSRKTAWEVYLHAVLALERDEDGNLPDIKQMQAYDPSVYTKVHDMYAAAASGELGLPPQYLGLYTEGNPVSAEGGQVSEGRLDRRARLDMGRFTPDLRKVAHYALRLSRPGLDLPEGAERLSVDWLAPEMFSVSQASDAIGKQVAAEAVSPNSDVVLKRLGYSPVERLRLEQDRVAWQGEQMLRAAMTATQTPNGGSDARNRDAGPSGADNGAGGTA